MNQCLCGCGQLTRNKFKRGHYIRYGDKFKQSVVKYYMDGHSTLECASRFNVGISAIANWLGNDGVIRNHSQAQNNRWVNVDRDLWGKKFVGVNNPNYRRGYRLSHGYKLISIAGNEIREHDLIAEKSLGRSLRSGECVHHLNGIKTDNRPENLLICNYSYHRWLHSKNVFSRTKKSVPPMIQICKVNGLGRGTQNECLRMRSNALRGH
jgi:hypothetical protein